MRFLLRPGWLALTVAVLGFVFACYYLLAPWQFHRSDERDTANAAVRAAATDTPVPRASLVTAGTAPSATVDYRPVIVDGVYEPAGEVLVRLRSVDGGAANEVLTPLRASTGETLLVDRGYVRPADSGALGPIAPAPPGAVRLVGYQRVDEPTSDRPAVEQNGHRQVYAANAAMVTAATGVPLSPGYVQLRDGQAGVLTAVPLPPPDPNSSYSYAWQWLIFGVFAIGGWVYFVRLEYLTRSGRPSEPRARTRADPRDRPDGTAWDADPGATASPDASMTSSAATPDRSTPATNAPAPHVPAPNVPAPNVPADRYGRR